MSRGENQYMSNRWLFGFIFVLPFGVAVQNVYSFVYFCSFLVFLLNNREQIKARLKKLLSSRASSCISSFSSCFKRVCSRLFQCLKSPS